MNLILALTPETEAKLREAAEREGKTPDTLAVEAIEDRVMKTASMAAAVPYEVWLKAWREDAKKLPPMLGDIDCSRESIYGNRDE